MRLIRKLAAVVTATAVGAATLAVPALAQVPPVDRYNCTSGYYIKIKPKHHYKFSVGKGGKFAYKPARQKIVFKTGYLHKDWYGGFRRDPNTKDPIVDIYLKDGSGSDTCYV